MKAIETKYFGPGNIKGSRVRATEPDGKSVTIPWNHELDAEENHKAAATALCQRMNWNGKLATGWLGKSYVHVFTDK